MTLQDCLLEVKVPFFEIYFIFLVIIQHTLIRDTRYCHGGNTSLTKYSRTYCCCWFLLPAFFQHRLLFSYRLPIHAVVCNFPSIEKAASAVIEMMRKGIRVPPSFILLSLLLSSLSYLR